MNLITDILIVLLGVFILISALERIEIKMLKRTVAAYEQQISMLKLDSEKQQANTKQAYEIAQKQMQQVRKETQAILSTKVPSDCEDSIQWLRKQAQYL